MNHSSYIPRTKAMIAPPGKGLSKREAEILSLLVQGYSYEAAADKLFISFLTLKTHVRNIFYKLNVKKRVEAVNYALKKDLLN